MAAMTSIVAFSRWRGLLRRRIILARAGARSAASVRCRVVLRWRAAPPAAGRAGSAARPAADPWRGPLEPAPFLAEPLLPSPFLAAPFLAEPFLAAPASPLAAA